MKHSELRHQPRHVNPRIQVACATNTDLHIPDNFPAMVFNNSFILHASPD